MSENFCYDVLNRVKGSIGSCNTFSYDNAGNVTKPGVALAYTSGTNRLSTVDGLGVTYDVGGNIKSDGTRIYSYTPYDVPDRISQGNQWMEFGFTGNGQRAYERDGANATASGITYFAGPGFFEQDNTLAANGVATISEVREYLATPAGTIGVVVTNASGTNMSLYLQDHLGSNVATVNAITGAVTRSSYDVWGVRSATLDKGNRGYTGHEHLDFGLIHMNGRVYDPRWGRFLQADPIIQSPYDLQNYNRYLYVMNNPLSFTDPTGFSRWTNFRDRYGKIALAIVASIVTYGAASEWVMASYGMTGTSATACYASVGAQAAATSSGVAGLSVATVAGAAGGAAAGFAAGGIMGGNLKSALTGAVTGAIGGGVGGYFGNSYSLERVAAESVAGGINSRIQGQSFASGFRKAVIFSLVTHANWTMRQEMIAQSRLNETGANANGISGGFMGDGFSLAGARAEYDSVTGEKLKCIAPLGGCQDVPNLATGDDPKNFFGLKYSPNSVPDRINEAFAGPHDWLRNATGAYDAMGNSQNVTGFALTMDKFMNFVNLVPAAPFAIGGLIQTQAPALIYFNGKRN